MTRPDVLNENLPLEGQADVTKQVQARSGATKIDTADSFLPCIGTVSLESSPQGRDSVHSWMGSVRAT